MSYCGALQFICFTEYIQGSVTIVIEAKKNGMNRRGNIHGK
jgi:hypothetical protein